MLYLFIDANDTALDIIHKLSKQFEETKIMENYTYSLKIPKLMIKFKNYGVSSKSLINTKQYIEKLYNTQLEYLLQIQNVANNYDKPKFIENKMQENLQYSLAFAKKHNLNIVEWFDNEHSEKYFYNVISKEYNDSTKYFMYVLPQSTNKIDLKEYSSIVIPCKEEFDQVFKISEDVYQYIDKIDSKRFKGTELFFNKIYKTVNKFLFDEYKININGKYVSRAWIKMYELLSNIDLLDKYNNDVTVFHICEAPGNFINSMMYFIKNKTKIKNYIWNAQSLNELDTQIFDEYGFIKETGTKWDFGITKTGDIMNANNFKYYIDKYSNIDLLIGDCGVMFEAGKKDNLAAYQLLYSLLLPKKGGSAIIKTFAVEYDDWYLSLLCTCTIYYEKVIIFKSSINFWSPEIYIVLKGFKGITTNERDFFINIGLTKKYPMSYLPAELCLAYKYFTNEIVVSYVNMKKLFVFLTKNPDIFEKNKDKFEKMINKQNISWLEKYMNHLPNVIENYKKFIS